MTLTAHRRRRTTLALAVALAVVPTAASAARVSYICIGQPDAVHSTLTGGPIELSVVIDPDANMVVDMGLNGSATAITTDRFTQALAASHENVGDDTTFTLVLDRTTGAFSYTSANARLQVSSAWTGACQPVHRKF